MEKLSEELKWRGFVNQTTYDNLARLDGEPISLYFGVDPSADSMTIGNLAAAMLVRHFINAGHNAYLLVGGATGMIGDPDGKADERNLKTIEEVSKNRKGIATQYLRIFEGKEFKVVDNYDWFKDIKYLDFLREVGKYMPVSQMLSRGFIKSRLGDSGSGISYAEFSYSLIQGFDFVYLNRKYGITLQLCGADQWGNCITGVDLLRRIDGIEAHVLSMPLIINKATGKKFGKSEEGAVWLDSNRTSVYKFYQYWLNVDDKDVIDYAKIYTFMSWDDLEALAKKQTEDPSSRIAQKTLATYVTDLVHGVERRNSVERVTDVLFGRCEFTKLNSNDVDQLASEIPTINKGGTVVEALFKVGYASSSGAARRLISSGAISVNGKKISVDEVLTKLSLVKKGKNNFILVR